MTDEEKIQKVREEIDKIMWQFKNTAKAGESALPWVVQILKLKGVAIIDEDAPFINIAHKEFLELFEILRRKHPEAFVAGAHAYAQAMEEANFKQVIR